MCSLSHFLFFFFNDPATTEIYTLSLHDALPISMLVSSVTAAVLSRGTFMHGGSPTANSRTLRSEEHTSELQSRGHLVCRLLLEKKKKTNIQNTYIHTNITHVCQ